MKFFSEGSRAPHPHSEAQAGHLLWTGIWRHPEHTAPKGRKAHQHDQELKDWTHPN
ncbi:MAG: hypothetical protein GY820_05905 [Gammaproteobacteria bacterium]|nr:hypothetical protein [Gammaproteobacteria bacterium]